MLPITEDFIQRVETLIKTQQQPFRASQMLQYEWRPGNSVVADDSNIDVPKDEKNLLVPDPVNQQNVVQDPKPFSILSNYEDRKNDDYEAQHF